MSVFRSESWTRITRLLSSKIDRNSGAIILAISQFVMIKIGFSTGAAELVRTVQTQPFQRYNPRPVIASSVVKAHSKHSTCDQSSVKTL